VIADAPLCHHDPIDQYVELSLENEEKVVIVIRLVDQSGAGRNRAQFDHVAISSASA
jgi:hypothetical protein